MWLTLSVYIHLVNWLQIYKVPADEMEALATSLMGMFEKRRFKKFLCWVQQFDVNNQETWQGLDPHTHTMQQVRST